MDQRVRETDIVIPANVLAEMETEEQFDEFIMATLDINELTKDETDVYYKPDDGSLVLRRVEEDAGESGEVRAI